MQLYSTNLKSCHIFKMLISMMFVSFCADAVEVSSKQAIACIHVENHSSAPVSEIAPAINRQPLIRSGSLSNPSYLMWDNHSSADQDDILDDPLIVLRMKHTLGKHDIARSWQEWAKHDIFAASVDLCRPSKQSSSLSLYPQESIDYRPLCNNHPEWHEEWLHSPLIEIDHKINPELRLESESAAINYESQYPIWRVKNLMAAPVILSGLEVVLQPHEEYQFSSGDTYSVGIKIEEMAKGALSITLIAVADLPWTFELGEDLLIGEPSTSGSLEVSTEFLDAKSDSLPLTLKLSQIGDGPDFAIEGQRSCEYLWWQIAADPQFERIFSHFDTIESYEPTLSIDAVSQTFLNPNTEYYLRARGIDQGQLGEWSEPIGIRLDKPVAVEDVLFEKDPAGGYVLSWDEFPETTYWIFASNAFDFVPEIYSDMQIDAIEDGVVTQFADNQNLVAKTQSNVFKVDGSKAYYRIIAEKNGRLSSPSPLIHIYDHGLYHPRTALQRVSDQLGSTKVFRITLPATAYAHGVPPFIDRFAAIPGMANVRGMARSPHVDEATWQKMAPYFMPDNHPLKPKLDRLFKASRVTLNESSILNAKFENAKPGKFSRTIVTKHKKLKGYYIKFFSDEQHVDDVRLCLKRVEGAAATREAIDRHGYQKLFKVPQKWIYPLPAEPSPPPGYHRKNFIVIAEDAEILKKKDNYNAWKSSRMTKERLGAFYVLLKEVGLCDSVYAFNSPFAKDGRIAFIDTEYYHAWPVHYHLTRKYLSPTMEEYWNQLIKQGGPK